MGDSKTGLLKIWKGIQSMTTAHYQKEPFRCLALPLTQTMEQTTEVFADHVFSLRAPALLDVPPPHPVPLFLGAPCASPHEAKEGPLDDRFTLREFHAFIAKLRRGSATGPDGVSNQYLKSLPGTVKAWLIARLNQI